MNEQDVNDLSCAVPETACAKLFLVEYKVMPNLRRIAGVSYQELN